MAARSAVHWHRFCSSLFAGSDFMAAALVYMIFAVCLCVYAPRGALDIASPLLQSLSLSPPPQPPSTKVSISLSPPVMESLSSYISVSLSLWSYITARLLSSSFTPELETPPLE